MQIESKLVEKSRNSLLPLSFYKLSSVWNYWYQSTGIALVDGALDILFLILKNHHLGVCFLQNTFCPHLSSNYWQYGKELVKRWKWCRVLTSLHKHGISANRVVLIWCIWSFTSFSLPDIIILIGPKGLQRPMLMCWAQSVPSTICTRQCFCKIQDGVPKM